MVGGHLSEGTLNAIRKGLPPDRPENSAILFFSFAYADIPIGRRYKVLFPQDHPELAVTTDCEILAVTQQFAKPFDCIPHGWRTVCLVRFLTGIPEMIQAQRTVDSWKYCTWLFLCDEETWKMRLKGGVVTSLFCEDPLGGHEEVADLISKVGADVNAIRYRIAPLHRAAGGGYLDLVKLLLDRGADVNAKSSNVCHTPLHFAVEQNHKGIVELLLARGANINAKDINGLTPLYWATELRRQEVAELLLSNDAEVDLPDNTGNTPLMRAAYHGFVDIAGLLLAHGANVNAKDKRGLMPLHWAAIRGESEVAILLLANLAEVNARDKSDETPLSRAVKLNRKDMAELLRMHGGQL